MAFLASLEVTPPEDIEPPEHKGDNLYECPGCQALPDYNDTQDPYGDKRLRVHLANGGDDPWGEVPP